MFYCVNNCVLILQIYYVDLDYTNKFNIHVKTKPQKQEQHESAPVIRCFFINNPQCFQRIVTLYKIYFL